MQKSASSDLQIELEKRIHTLEKRVSENNGEIIIGFRNLMKSNYRGAGRVFTEHHTYIGAGVIDGQIIKNKDTEFVKMATHFFHKLSSEPILDSGEYWYPAEFSIPVKRKVTKCLYSLRKGLLNLNFTSDEIKDLPNGIVSFSYSELPALYPSLQNDAVLEKSAYKEPCLEEFGFMIGEKGIYEFARKKGLTKWNCQQIWNNFKLLITSK